jgi:hypothetical protein
MTVFVFLGPTLDTETAVSYLDAVYLPPVSQGDVLRAMRDEPTAIGIVDGRFHDVPAVWHKEIMWALSRGVPVYGSASMGALRAAELAAYGMRGIGGVYEAVASGILEDDDEVAVAHGDAASGYRTTSEAMVNIRQTLAAATDHDVISRATATALARLVKQTYYPLRTYREMLSQGEKSGLPGHELKRLRAWLPDNQVNQKALDAVEMLRTMSHEIAADAPKPNPDWVFEHTEFFETSQQESGWSSAARDLVTTADLLEEVRLDPTMYAQVKERATLRVLLAAGAAPSPDLAQAAENFRRARGLLGAAQAQEWLARNDLSESDFAAIVGVEDLVRRNASRVAEQRPEHIVNQLRIDGAYAPLVRRAARKRTVLLERGIEHAAAPDVRSTHLELEWYFGRLQIPVPAPAMLREHWQALEYPDENSFLRAVHREYWYQQGKREEQQIESRNRGPGP